MDAHESSLRRLFTPRSIAVVGASDRPGRIGTTVYANVAGNFDGPVHPVNPRGGVLLGREAVTSVEELPDGIDMAVVAIPADQAVGTVRRLGEKGVGGVTLLTAGFAEAGADGVGLQAELAEVARSTGVRIVGPNCIGFMNVHHGVQANFMFVGATGKAPVAGPVALVSQSGGFGSYIATKSVLSGVQLGWFVSTGNEVDVNLAGVLAHLVEQDEVGVLLVFSETLRDPEVFVGAARRAAELDKPMVLLKAGRSDAAARAALSHTASIVGSAAVLDAVCEQHGVIVVRTMEELLDLGMMFQTGRRAGGRGLAVITSSGGAGVLLADCAATEGLDVPTIPEPQAKAIESHMPQPFMGSVANPIDTTAQITARPDAFRKVLDATLAVDGLDLLTAVVWGFPNPQNDAVVASYARSTTPIALLSTGYLESFHEAGIPTYLDPQRAVHALAALARYSLRPPLDPLLPERPPAGADHPAAEVLGRATGRRLLLESDAKEILAAYGAPVTTERTVGDAAAAVAAAAELGGAVALKVMSYELPHKSDVGGLRLGLRTPAEIAAGHAELLAEVARRAPYATVESVLVQEMVPARLELACGMRRDPVFGPVVAVGLGGVTIEIMAATELVPAPFGRAAAERCIRGLLDGRLVTAARGLTDAEVEQVAGLMVALGELAVDFPQITEIDVNPVRVGDGRAVAADALIGLDDQGVA